MDLKKKYQNSLIYKTITSCDKPDYLSEEEAKTLLIN